VVFTYQSARTIPRWPRLFVVAVLLLVIFTAAEAPHALAGDLGGYTADGVNIRTGPHLSDTVVGLGYSNQNFCGYFSVQGDTPPGWGISTWTYHENLSTTVTGYSFNGYLIFYSGQTC
jgi:hypothetical protein